MNEPRLLRKPRFFIIWTEVQKAGDPMMKFGYFTGILLSMTLLLTGVRKLRAAAVIPTCFLKNNLRRCS